MKLTVTNEEIRFLRGAYARDLKRETQASESVRNFWRQTIAVFDEVLANRRALLAPSRQGADGKP